MDDPTPRNGFVSRKKIWKEPPPKVTYYGVWLNHQPLRASTCHLLSGHLQNPKKSIGLSEFTWVYLSLSEFTWVYLSLSEFIWVYLSLSKSIYLPRVPTVAVYLSTYLSSLESNLNWSSLIMANQICLSFIHAITFPLPSHYLPILCPSNSSFMDPAPTCCSRAMLCSLANANPSVAMPTGRWSNDQRNILAM